MGDDLLNVRGKKKLSAKSELRTEKEKTEKKELIKL